MKSFVFVALAALLAATLSVAPAATAAPPECVQDLDGCVDNVRDPVVDAIRECTWYGPCGDIIEAVQDILESDPAPGFCYTYNPDAIANACVTPSSGSTPVSHPTVTLGSREVCPIGYETCRDVPYPGLGTTTTHLPAGGVDGYVEVTFLCGCRVDLP